MVIVVILLQRLSGIVSSLASSFIPVNELQGSIQIRITIVRIAQTNGM